MFETFSALLAAHLLADFVFQTRWMIDNKRIPWVMGAHVAIVALLSFLLLGRWSGSVLAIVAITHAVMDCIKTYALADDAAAFLADQGVHLLVIGAASLLFPDTATHGWWPRLSHAGSPMYWAGVNLVSGIVAGLPGGGVLIRKITEPLTAQIAEDAASSIEGLRHAGVYIGWLERGLVMLLILINQPAGVGFLITAKSILRFGDVKDSQARKATEYIIIGTFMSFGWGLLVAVLTQRAVAYALR